MDEELEELESTFLVSFLCGFGRMRERREKEIECGIYLGVGRSNECKIKSNVEVLGMVRRCVCWKNQERVRGGEGGRRFG